MATKQIIECVPNFSEGRDLSIIKQITDKIESVEGVKLLDVDPGYATNRTVVTFVGEPIPVIEAAYLAVKMASELIDMTKHSGEHPRMGATDVCPLIPISGISLEEIVPYAHQLAARIGNEIKIPVYCYEEAATEPKRRNLATIRAGEFEGMEKKIALPEWKPDFGPTTMGLNAGVTAVGVRDFLIAYNVNLNTSSVRRANSVAFDIREKGRVLREGNPITGKVAEDADGNPKRTVGMCPAVKAIGWYIEEYGLAQISMNLTDIKQTNLHEAFEACRQSANKRGMRVTGSELVGLVPKKVMLTAGRYFLSLQERSLGISEEEIIHIAIKSLGLDELAPFDPKKKIIEYLLEEDQHKPLINMTLSAFADETASESPAPGGGSISAYVGSLGAALGAMVANLSAHKRGWDDRWEEFSDLAVTGQDLKDRLVALVDSDTAAFNDILAAIRLPKESLAEKEARSQAINDATKNAIAVPKSIMTTCAESYEFLDTLATTGNPNSISDIGVGALCIHAAIHGAYLNVQINCADLDDKNYVDSMLADCSRILDASKEKSAAIMQKVEQIINK